MVDRPRFVTADLLRAAAAMSLFAYHASTYGAMRRGQPHGSDLLGTLAVAGFLVLTGMLSSISKEATAADYARTVFRRIRNVMITYWIIAVPVLALGIVSNRISHADYWKVPLWLAGLGVVSPRAFLPPVSSWWYISLAIQAAIVAPLLHLALHRGSTPEKVLRGALAITAFSCLAVYLLPPHLRYIETGFVGSRTFALALGAVVLSRREEHKVPPRSILALAVPSLALVWLLPACFGAEVGSALLIVLAYKGLSALEGRLATEKISPIASSLAALSLPFLLVHPVLLQTLMTALPSSTGWQVMAVTASLAGAALASAAIATVQRRGCRKDA